MGTTTYPSVLDAALPVGEGIPASSGVHANLMAAIRAIETRLGVGAALMPIRACEMTFTETAGAGAYTASVVLPAGSYLLDVFVHGTAVWDNAGTATLIVGDTDDDGIFTAVNLKATDLLAAEGLSAALAGGKAGADIANSQFNRRYLATERTFNAKVTTSSTGGTAGRTRVVFLWVEPAATAVAATKV